MTAQPLPSLPLQLPFPQVISSPSLDKFFSTSNLESFLRQILSLPSNTSVALSTTLGNTRWYLDFTGCNHMTSASHIFSSISTTDVAPFIHIANGSFMHVSHKGTISLSNVTLPNTYLIPKLNFNLISIGQLCDLGYEIIFSSSDCCVQVHRRDKSLRLYERLEDCLSLLVFMFLLHQTSVLLRLNLPFSFGISVLLIAHSTIHPS